MDMSGEVEISAKREVVWAALNDPTTLEACIPGCEAIENVSDTQFSARVRTKIGPVKALFAADLNLENLDPPNGYTLSGQGKGGAAGFARGAAHVSLVSRDAGTTLRYEVDMQVGGKLAQIGSRLVAGAARKIADQFFANFAKQLA